jgi:hypothetical protein
MDAHSVHVPSLKSAFVFTETLALKSGGFQFLVDLLHLIGLISTHSLNTNRGTGARHKVREPAPRNKPIEDSAEQ